MIPEYYAIVESLADLSLSAKLGYPWVQFRNKTWSNDQMIEVINTFTRRRVTEDQKCLLNDDIVNALKFGFDGCHLGQEDLLTNQAPWSKLPAGFILGLSVHDEKELETAALIKPTYIAIGKLFPSENKPHIAADIEKMALLAEKCRKRLPSTSIVGIGGVAPSNFRSTLKRGFDCLASIGWHQRRMRQEIGYESLLEQCSS